MPNLILYNGKLHTQDPRYPQATALAIRGERIFAVGSDSEIRPLSGPGTRQVDLGGRRVLPGLVDAHFHFYDWSLSRRQLALAGTNSLAEMLERLSSRAHETPPGQWILGQGWNETRWTKPHLPTIANLDASAPHHPVILWRSDLHLAVANSLALQQAGITRNTPDPPDGVIDRNPSGEPTGILRELAINLVREAIPPPSEPETLAAMRDGMPVLHSLGLTGLHDFRIMGGAEGPPAFRAYQCLQADNQLNLRLWMNIPGERLDEAIALGLRTGFGDDHLRVGHVKFFSDGSQGARTAWMLDPYVDNGQFGMPLTPMESIAESVRKADRAGLAVAIHAIGDRANRELLDVFEEVLGGERESQAAPPSAPHRIEHVQNIRPADIQRLARLKITASVQPIHATDDMPMIEASVGDRSRWAYAFRDMLNAGVKLAMGSDCPVADPNPLWGIHAAVTRQQRDGTPAGGWYPQQRLTVAEAIWGYTAGPALVTGQESRIGSLAPGKLADLVVLDRDIFAIDPMQIAQTRVVMTFFDGEMVYQAA